MSPSTPERGEAGTVESLDRPALILRLKNLLIEGLRLDLRTDDIGDTTPIFGEDGLKLDSIDALELVVLVEDRFAVSIPDEETGRVALESVSMLADYILAEREKR
jgi:acyl carrier protein